MARALLVGCGCHARAAGRLLQQRGWAVRGSSRSGAGREAIAAAGLEAAEADPDRVGTIVAGLGDVTVLCWLLGSATGSPDEVGAVHGPRLESLLEKVVDTPVRGFVYEAAGSAAPELLAGGRELVEAASARWRIPAEFVLADRHGDGGWAEAVADAVESAVGL